MVGAETTTTETPSRREMMRNSVLLWASYSAANILCLIMQNNPRLFDADEAKAQYGASMTEHDAYLDYHGEYLRLYPTSDVDWIG